MASPALDEGLERLAEFNALLQETSGRLRDGLAALEAHEEDVARLVERIEDEVEEVAGTLLTGGDRAEATHREAVAAAETLAERAVDAGERRLRDLGAAIESLERTVEEHCEGSRTTLGSDADHLEDEGFEALEGAVESVSDDMAAADHETGLAFDDLTGALEALDVRLSDVRFDTHTALREAGARLEDEDEKGLEEVCAACTAEWSGELEETLRKRCADMGDEMEELYDGCLDEVEAEGQSLVAGAAGLLKAAARDDIGGNAAALAGTIVAVRSDGFDTLQAELDALLSLLDAEQKTAEAVPPLVENLEAASAVIDDIEKMLEELAR